jgi:hypothetical protein
VDGKLGSNPGSLTNLIVLSSVERLNEIGVVQLSFKYAHVLPFRLTRNDGTWHSISNNFLKVAEANGVELDFD